MPYNPVHQRGRAPFAAPSVGSSSNVATYEEENVHKVYDVIAGHFSSTRYKPWPRVAEFMSGLPDHSVVADVGCGNGKYLGVNPKVMALGSDICENLVKICVDRGFEGLVCNGLQLPYRTGAFDAAISIAVVHHFATPENRRAALEEIMRIMRVGGRCLVYVWAWIEEKHEDQDLFVPWTFQKRFQTDDMSAEALKERGGQEDEKGDVIFNRYYHMFKQGELPALFEDIPGTRVVEEYFDHENWAVIAEKIA